MRTDTRKIKAYILLALITVNTILPTTSAWALSGGPSQPEVQGFEPAGTSQMVDLSSGSFVYNIPLCEIGGYPLNLSYHSGITMDQEASVVGLGWSLNPGVVNRNMRGLPDDFKSEEVTKEFNIAPNRTYGITVGTDIEVVGLKKEQFTGASLQASLGVSYNNYKGVGFNFSVRPGLSFGKIGGDKLTANLGLNASTFGGVEIEPDLNFSSNITHKDIDGKEITSNISAGGGVGINSRRGIQALTLSTSYNKDNVNRSHSFASSSYTPQYSLPYINLGISARLKTSIEIFAVNPGVFISGSYSVNKLMEKHSKASAFGYMYAQDGRRWGGSLMDFNRELDGGFTKNRPNLPIVVPTQDIYAVSGQGIGGSYQLKRGDIGVMYDKFMANGNESGSLGFEVGGGNAFRLGGPISINSTLSTSGKWVKGNDALQYLDFVDTTQTAPDYETAYFKVAGEKTVESDPNFITKIGGNEAVSVGIRKSGVLNTNATRELVTKSGRVIPLSSKVKREKREKRNQSITWLNAQEATQFALDKKITTYPLNDFNTVPNLINRASEFRKNHHISEVTTLREDGVRYVYGIPAYNTEQKEVSFSVSEANPEYGTGLISYNQGQDNSIDNKQGPENYFNRVTTPAYAHSYLLTSVVSPDYIDIDGNGCSRNDIGTYTKFNYTRQSDNYQWRTPINQGKANYNEGFKSDKSDGKANYIYGRKEIWYVHSIESKNEVARFFYSDRPDGNGVAGENGGMSRQSTNRNKKLDRIEIYTRAGLGTELSEPIKTIYFEYDNALCRNSPNIEGNVGKLTLRKVYFTYGDSKKGKLSPYKFYYAGESLNGQTITGINPTYNLKAYDRWGFYKPNAQTDANGLSNADFPYTEQDKATADSRATAWNLTKIQLPSGGEINVNYESNDYSSVQDKRAMQMFQILGLTDNVSNGDNVPAQVNGDLYTQENKTANRYILFKLKQPLETNDKDIAKNFIRDMYLNGAPEDFYLYFKCLIALDGASKYEYVPGYYKLEPNEWGVLKSSSGADKYDVGYIKLKAARTDDNNTSGDILNPITKAALNFTRMHLPKIAYGEPDIRDGQPGDIWKALTSMTKQVAQMAVGFNKQMVNNGYSKNLNPSRSWIRLHVPNYTKYGGGCRVKSITMNDNWQSMTNADYSNSEYGQEYTYTTEATLADGTQREISSGVASYEPLIGGDENPFKQPIFYNEKNLLAPDDNYMIEGPIGESLYPGPSIIYSKVKVRNIQRANVKNTATGWTISEYYTSKDFPTVFKQTDLNPIRRSTGPSAIMSFLKVGSKDFMTASQGYVIETNDMHGKPKAQWNFDEKGNKISGVEYKYKTDKDNPQLLDNNATVVTPDGKTSTAQIGVDYTVLTDARQSETTTHNTSMNFNVDNFVAFLFITLPTVFPGITDEQTRFQSISVTKLINRTGLLDKVVAYEHGAQIETANVAYDSETGDVLLTRSQNEYGDNHYNFTFPAHWAYEGMQAAYKNTGVVLKGNFVYNTEGYLGLEASQTQYFSFGDEVACRLGSSDTKAWVIDVKKEGNQIKLVDERGLLLSSGTYSRLKVLRSGRRNMQATPIAAVKTKTPIINGNTLVFNNVLDASATEFSDNWQTGAEVAYYDGYYKVPSLDNPYTVGAKGNWRPMRSWSYLIDRRHTDSLATTLNNSTANSDVRVDGVFKSFNPFWKIPNASGGLWQIDSSNWTWSKRNTKIDGHGNSLESIDALGRYDAKLMGYNNTLVTAIADNARYNEIAFDSYEDVYSIRNYSPLIQYSYTPNFSFPLWFNWTFRERPYSKYVYNMGECISFMNQIDPEGNWSVYEADNKIKGGGLRDGTIGGGYEGTMVFSDGNPIQPIPKREYYFKYSDKPNAVGPSVWSNVKENISLSIERVHSGRNSVFIDSLEAQGNLFHIGQTRVESRNGVNLKAGKYILSAWVSVKDLPQANLTYENTAWIRISINGTSTLCKPSGNIIDGWQRIYAEFTVPNNVTTATLSYVGKKAYFDDLRIHPYNANMKSFVYDPLTLRLVAELDENNYPTYYEYDKAGNLTHVKKVTEKGVQTVKEVRAGTVKKLQ